MKIFSSKKRVAVIGALTAVTLVGGGTAFAYWTSIGQGDGSVAVGTTTDNVTLTAAVGTITGTLAPGGPGRDTTVSVTNNGPGTAQVTAVTVSVAGLGGTPWEILGPNGGCDASDFSLNLATAGDPVDLVPDFLNVPGTTTSAGLPLNVAMVNKTDENQDDCKNVTVPLHVSIS
jgi:hypothetical protein